jgi:M6 family metalloprotease-like protein
LKMHWLVKTVKMTGFNLHERQSRKCMFFVSVFMLVFTLSLLFSPIFLWAAPFSKYFQFTQPDNVQLTLWGEGDEFHAIFETTSNYTVVFDPKLKAYFYAKRAVDGKNLISSGVLAHKPVPPDLAKHTRMDHDAVIAAARDRQKQWDAETGLSKRWARLKSQTLGTPSAPDDVSPLLAPPETTTIGTKIGLTLLIDFSDAPATISQMEIEAFLNGDSYTGSGNNGSVKKYFSDVSGSRLTYTNVVTIYVRMTQPKSYYNDTSKNSGTQARLLINDALAILKARSDYNSTILPTFSSHTTDGSGNVAAFNVFFAGANSGVWSYGLWPNSWVLASPVSLGNGKSIYAYQITDIDTSPELGTFSHENGHMLCHFPDIYDYGYDSKGGAGIFCLMNSGGYGTNPVQVNAYLKLAAGWATVTDLAAPDNGYDHFYRYRRPGVATEYFLLENRQKTGRDANLPAAGIAVWHIDELGDRDNQSMTPNSSHLNYEVTLVQADNQWHFQNNGNYGDAFDLYYQGNSAAAYTNRLADSSAPHAHWWDGTASGMNLNGFSVAGISMTFNAAPTAVIGAPSATLTKSGPVTYAVTYTGADTVTLADANVTLNKTGTANGTATVSGTGNTTRTVTISGITGDGTLGISIAAGMASDSVGNPAAAVGPSSTFSVDNTAPTATIGSPSATVTKSGPVTYTVTYTGADAVTLVNDDVTLNKIGTASGTVAVSGEGNTARTVTISGITGDGTLGISIAAGTASDSVGNLAAAVGPSSTFTVDNTAPVTTALPVGGFIGKGQAVTLTPSEAAIIYYTLDGSPPDTNSTVYIGPIPLATDATVQFFAQDLAGNMEETVRTATYLIAPPGDVNFSGDVDLADAILSIQVLAGMTPAGAVCKEADVDGDWKIGMAEVIYIMQKVAGMR